MPFTKDLIEAFKALKRFKHKQLKKPTNIIKKYWEIFFEKSQIHFFSVFISLTKNLVCNLIKKFIWL